MFFSLIAIVLLFSILIIDFVYAEIDHRFTSYMLAIAVIVSFVTALVYTQKDMKNTKEKNKKEQNND